MTKLEIFLILYIILSNIIMALFVNTNREKTLLQIIYAIVGFPLTAIILSIQCIIEKKKEKI
ncbi:hypothetical protein [Methanoculleus sp.]|uniref:hypothetical protein n=1 Tax=Methanoculleus sp. TaxID=90427 RepID=UPI0025DB54B7|nr:hypothetical protein [Methanoculleus sp.]MCK9319539.1 hypothetical protein [Methanoculleus sp.]